MSPWGSFLEFLSLIATSRVGRWRKASIAIAVFWLAIWLFCISLRHDHLTLKMAVLSSQILHACLALAFWTKAPTRLVIGGYVPKANLLGDRLTSIPSEGDKSSHLRAPVNTSFHLKSILLVDMEDRQSRQAEIPVLTSQDLGNLCWRHLMDVQARFIRMLTSLTLMHCLEGRARFLAHNFFLVAFWEFHGKIARNKLSAWVITLTLSFVILKSKWRITIVLFTPHFPTSNKHDLEHSQIHFNLILSTIYILYIKRVSLAEELVAKGSQLDLLGQKGQHSERWQP